MCKWEGCELIEDVLGLGGCVGDDRPAEDVLQFVETRLYLCSRPDLIVEFLVVLPGLLAELGVAARECLRRCEEEVLRGNRFGRDQDVCKERTNSRIDALAVGDAVLEEEGIDVGLPGAVRCFTEIVLFCHCFAEL